MINGYLLSYATKNEQFYVNYICCKVLFVFAFAVMQFTKCDESISKYWHNWLSF